MNLETGELSTIGLWLAVIGSGLYHGVNPGMGWPLAVSAGLMGNGRRDLFAALGPLAGGHLLAMTGILLPFVAMSALITWQQEIRIAAALILIAVGIWLFFYPRHPRSFARIRPTQLALWSFAVATAHGAGLMLVPIYLGLCRVEEVDAGHQAAAALISGNLIVAIMVSVVHAAAMIVTGGAVAFAVHQWLGLKFLSKSWFNLDAIWAASLVLIGGISLAAAINVS